ncbi:carboxymuconolactone decarboxylase family protein [Natrononativus amylolyticus]|uniref:carboxymuconolactone decarboxylase family protein n=1 Tax=Natrononativus amylolyticus TaxID=2963434 RepID=UPI0020CE6DD9|nr:carboxymuconolactone decarboxylase family protein [Natrononativus amylolyticus]
MARVPYVTQDDLDPEYQELVVSSLQPGKTVNVYSAIGNNQEVLRGLREFLGALWNHSGLTDRQREIVILTAASEIGSAYEWHQHVTIATDAGLEPAEIGAIARDDRRALPDEERALVAYTRAVVRGRVTDALHEAVVEYVGEETTVGAAATAAGYLALGRIIDALDVDLEAGDEFVGWDPE